MIFRLSMDADTHKITPAVVSSASAAIEADGNDDDNKTEDDKRNCTSLPLCYDRVSNNIQNLFNLSFIHTTRGQSLVALFYVCE